MKILDHLNNRKKMVFQMTIVVVLCFAWFWLLKNHSVQKATYTDECVYMAQAHHLAKSSTLFSNFYMYESLLEQKPPLMPARHIAYISILGTIYKVFGFHEELYLYLNFFLLFIFLYCLFQFGAKKLELAGRSWLAVLLFVSFPLTNFLARLSMADILVIVSFFLLIWLMFFYEPEGQMKRWYPFGLVLFFWFCYLSRQTAIFILPVFLIWVCVKQGWKKAVCYGVLFLSSHFLIYWFIERWTARFLFCPL